MTVNTQNQSSGQAAPTQQASGAPVDNSPSIDQVLDQFFPKNGAPEFTEQEVDKARGKEEAPKDDDLNAYDAKLEAKRKAFLEKKRLQKERESFIKEKEEWENQKKKASKPDEQEIKEEILEDEPWLTPAELRIKLEKELTAKLKKEIFEELTAKEKEKENVSREEQVKNDFLDKIESFAEENEDRFPFTIEFGSSEEVFEIMDEYFIKVSERYGVEYARENILPHEKAMQILEKRLAEKWGSKLKSSRLQKALGLSTQSHTPNQSTTPRSLSSDMTAVRSLNDGPEDFDERIKWATQFINEGE